MLRSPPNHAVSWVQSCGAWLGPGATLVAEAPGKDLQRRWYFFNVFVSVVWSGLSYSLEVAEPVGSPLSPDSPGMQVSVTTTVACLQLAADPGTGWKAQFRVLVLRTLVSPGAPSSQG